MKKFFNRLGSVYKYLKASGPVMKWRLSNSHCPNCHGKYFLSLDSNAFMTRCLKCSANVTNLSVIPVIEAHRENHAIETAWEMSTYGATLDYLKKNITHVYESEYFPGSESGQFVNNVQHQDVQNISFKDSSLDLITSNQVFEHVENDIQGFKECYRVLKQGGVLIFTVPLFDIKSTQQLARIENNKVIHLEKPEYHDSRRGGPNSALCFWRHSYFDIIDRVSKVGFQSELIEIRIPESLKNPSYVIYAKKCY